MNGAREQTSMFGGVIDELATLFRRNGVDVPESASTSVAVAPERLAVCAWFDSVLARGNARTRDACGALARVAPLLCWRQNAAYRDADFLIGYGYCELSGPRGHRRDTRKSVGVLLLAPRTFYPPHRHPATEAYVVLAGSAEWQLSNGPWLRREPGEVIHHPSMAAHAMRTHETPLLAAYLWTDHLDAPASLVEGRVIP